MESCFETIAGRDTQLGEFTIGIQLYGQQRGEFHHLLQLAKVLADAFFLGVGVSHQ